MTYRLPAGGLTDDRPGCCAQRLANGSRDGPGGVGGEASLGKRDDGAVHMVGMTTEKSKVIAVGDLHGNVRWLEKIMRSGSKAGHRIIIFAGDTGFLWPAANNNDRLAMLAVRWAEKYDFEAVYVVDGNHDNHKALRSRPLNEAGFGIIGPRIFFVPRGHRWTIDGVRFGAVGGAYSVDRKGRTWGKSLFEGEEVTAADVERLGTAELEVLVTHEVPVSVPVISQLVDPLPEEIAWLAREGRQLVEQAARATNPAVLICGHWHQRLSSQIPSTRTRVEVLHRDGHQGSAVVLNLNDLSIEPFDTPPFN